MNSQHFYKFKITTKIFFSFLFFTLFLFNETTIFAQKKDFVVVLDAGHGGKDPGKVGYRNIKEKNIALKIVLQIGKLLEKEKHIKVIYTRKTDVFVDLWERGSIANRANADLFISIHCNAHSSQAYGAETWVLGIHANKQNFEIAKSENSVILLEKNYKEKYNGFNPNKPESIIGITLMQEEYLDQSIQLASIIQKRFKNELKRKDRGVKQAGFVVLYQTYMPSVLIETGFITNKIEGPFLNSIGGSKKIATSIYKDIIQYKNQLTLNSVAESDIPKIIDKKKLKSKQRTPNLDIIYKVQIAAGARKLATKSYNFKGIKNIERIKVGHTYKYYIGSTPNFKKVKAKQHYAKTKGYKSAFIVAFKNGKRISLQKVLGKS
ncbi:N-acetylmuramoyl-L-alanine amidase [Lutibacter sp.]|uniref:N-acetylmuramoyl-L-alanine amidase family protein n=1 Tax=Lutibacter sp. TaxID=1925666 RepID=UPI0025C21929|nr:N-acetylmuramoyl-L-alanine amidase [Lutibacter sp.]MCF6180755.1 N-acetylmuramoyl-L-alanine amidase [Lutibacter sp.]